jgi:Ca2+-binding EF-hand superfamily protein
MDYHSLEKRAAAILHRLGDIDPQALVRTLSISQQQLVEIAKALTLDTNGDGVLDENELEGRAGGFVRRLQEQAGLGTSGKVQIEKLTTELAKQRGEQSGDSGQERRGREPLIKYGGTDFGVSTELEEVLGFDAPPDASGSWQSKYDARIVSQVNELMAKHDTNKSHYLEIHEWPEVPFRSDPSEDDADGDGRISRAELAAHLHKHANRNRRGGDERTERGDRGDDTRGERATRGVAPEGDRSTRGGTSQPTTTLTSTRSAPTGDPNRRHAQSLMEQYDLDEDGYLDEEEWSQLRGPDPAEFDKNGDGYLSLDELTARIASMIFEMTI